MADCVFCAIVVGREPASVVYEDEAMLAFMDLRQANPGHVLVIPKVHVELVYDLDADTAGRLFQATVSVARALRASLAPAGLNIYGERPRVAGRAELDKLAERMRRGVRSDGNLYLWHQPRG